MRPSLPAGRSVGRILFAPAGLYIYASILFRRSEGTGPLVMIIVYLVAGAAVVCGCVMITRARRRGD